MSLCKFFYRRLGTITGQTRRDIIRSTGWTLAEQLPGETTRLSIDEIILLSRVRQTASTFFPGDFIAGSGRRPKVYRRAEDRGGAAGKGRQGGRSRTGRERSPRRARVPGVGAGCGRKRAAAVAGGVSAGMFPGGRRCRDRFLADVFRADLHAAGRWRAERFVRSRFRWLVGFVCVRIGVPAFRDFADFQAGRRIFPGKSLFSASGASVYGSVLSGNDDPFIILYRDENCYCGRQRRWGPGVFADFGGAAGPIDETVACFGSQRSAGGPRTINFREEELPSILQQHNDDFQGNRTSP